MGLSRRAPHRPIAQTWGIDDLLDRAQQGRLRVPLFQRKFVWQADDVRKLFDSIYRGYPIGDLILWDTGATDNTAASFETIDFPTDRSDRTAFVVIDGQQRLTSLVATLLGPQGVDPRFTVAFDLESLRFVAGGHGGATHLPLSVVGSTRKYLEWLQRNPLSPSHLDEANELVKALRDFKVPVYTIEGGDEAHVREIFMRLNETGKSLKASEIFGALKRGTEADISALEKGANDLAFGSFDSSWLLKMLAAVLDLDTTRSRFADELREMANGKVAAGMDRTSRALGDVVRLLRDDALIPHLTLLPYRFPLVPLVKLLDLHPYDTLAPRIRHGLRAWLWREALSGHHVRSDAPTVRRALEAIGENVEVTLEAWLQRTSGEIPWGEIPATHDFRAAQTKVFCWTLARLGPRHLVTGEPIDVPALLDERGANAFIPVAPPSRATPWTRTTANRILHPPLSDPQSALARAPQAVLESHTFPFHPDPSLEEIVEERRAELEQLTWAVMERLVARA